MCEELIELMSLDLIKFPKEYDGKGYIVEEITNKETKELELQERKLTLDEEIALINIDAMKSEIIQIHGFKDANGVITRYANPDQHAHDDRFYTLLLLAHKLYELRRNNLIKSDQPKNNWSNYFFHN